MIVNTKGRRGRNWLMIILWMLYGGSSSIASQLDGWRRPTKNDYVGDWLTYEKENPQPFYAKGDFDGDGKPDEAWILISKDGSSWGVFVFLSGRPEAILLDKKDATKIKPQSMGISTMSPADYKKICQVRNDPECKTLMLKNDAIDYFTYESASSVFYWDDQNREFKRFWQGD